MNVKPKAIFNWSSGKDSALCLYKILQADEYDVICLLTSINEQYQRISMHGVRVEMLEAQADRIGIPLVKLMVPEMPTMEVYESEMKKTLSTLKGQGATVSIFGDIFLEDLRKYREEKLQAMGFRGVFPLWKIPTKTLISTFIDLGFRTITTCVNDRYLDKSFVGRIIDHDFLNDLPEHVDPCGENGEFHTFTFDGPLFREPVLFEKGEIVYRKYAPAKQESNSQTVCDTKDADQAESPFDGGFWYCDLLLV